MREVHPPRPTWGEWLDGVLGVLWPEWAAERTMHRATYQNAVRLGYRGARHSRLGKARPGGGRADYHAEGTFDRRDLVDRARQLERSSVIAESLLSRSAENVVGCGFRLQAGTNSPQWNKRAEALWTHWAADEADVRGLCSFDELLSLIYRSWLRDGDVGTILLADGSLQTVESDQISSPYGHVLQKRHVDGIDLDRRGRPVAYHVVDDPDPISPAVRYQAHTKVPADQILFLARRQRLGQTRGMSAFANIAWLLDQIDGNVEAVTVAARMAACFGLLLKKQGGMPNLPTGASSDGITRRKLTVEPGSVQEIDLKDEVVQVKPEQPTTNWPDFLVTLFRLAGLSFGLPLEVAFMDVSRANYSSIRAGLLQAWQGWRVNQAALKRFCAAVYRWKVINWIEQGLLPLRQDALAHTFIAPGWRWVDPAKEIGAFLAAIDAGFETHAGVAANMGKDGDELIEARGKEIEKFKAAGIPEVRSTLTRDPQPVPSRQGPQDEPDEQPKKKAAA